MDKKIDKLLEKNQDLEKNKTRVVNAFCEKEIQYKLKNFSSDATMEEDFNHDIQMFLDSIDVHKMYIKIGGKNVFI